MKQFLIVFVVFGLITAPAEMAEADEVTRTVEASYYGPQLLYEFGPCADSGAAGCVTIETDANEGSLPAEVVDAHGKPVSVWVTDGVHPIYGTFCGQTTEPILFDPGATLELWIGGEWWPRWWILPKPSTCLPAIATTGTIHVTLNGHIPSDLPTDDPTTDPRP